MSTSRKLLIEGYSVEEILAFPNEELDRFVFCGEPIVFRAGSAEILGRFERTDDTLILELAHIDGGGEGALPALGALASRYAAKEKLAFLEWRVHAVNRRGGVAGQAVREVVPQEDPDCVQRELRFGRAVLGRQCREHPLLFRGGPHRD